MSEFVKELLAASEELGNVEIDTVNRSRMFKLV